MCRDRLERTQVCVRSGKLDGQLDDATLIKGVAQRNQHLELTLQEATNPQALLQRPVTAGPTIYRFEMVEPGLDEIFIQVIARFLRAD